MLRGKGYSFHIDTDCQELGIVPIKPEWVPADKWPRLGLQKSDDQVIAVNESNESVYFDTGPPKQGIFLKPSESLEWPIATT